MWYNFARDGRYISAGAAEMDGQILSVLCHYNFVIMASGTISHEWDHFALTSAASRRDPPRWMARFCRHDKAVRISIHMYGILNQCTLAPNCTDFVYPYVYEHLVPCLSLIHISEPTRLGMISYAV